MAPQLPTLIDEVPIFENQFENPGNQITTALHNPGTINEFLELYRRRSLTGEKCDELQEFLKQVSEFESKYKISFSLLVKAKQAITCRSDSFSLQNLGPGLNPFIFMDLVDMIKQAEIIRDVQFVQVDRHGNGGENETKSEISPVPPLLNYNSIVVDIPVVVTRVQVSASFSRQQLLPLTVPEYVEALLQPGKEGENINRCRRRRGAKKSMNLGKTFFPLTVQAGLSVLTSVFDAGGLPSTAEAKRLLNIAAGGNMVGYIGCLADSLLSHRCKSKAAEIMGRIGSTAAVFGILTMMGSVLGLKPMVAIGVTGVVAVVFFLVVIK